MEPVPVTTPELQHRLPGHGLPQPRIEPSPLPALILRLLLIGCFIASGLYAWAQPVERSVAHLLAELSEGNVTSVAMDRPGEGLEGSWMLRVNWTQDSGRDGYATYTYSYPSNPPQQNEGTQILAAIEASPAPVDVTVNEGVMARTGVTWQPAGAVALMALMVIIFGPQPRLATKWAWFWTVSAMPPLWLAFLALEPVPIWRRRAMAPRLERFTGGWAFLLAIALGAIWQTIAWF